MRSWTGLGRRQPVIAAAFAVLLLALAGIPLTSGFIAKFAVFSAAVDAGAVWLVVLGVLGSTPHPPWRSSSGLPRSRSSG
ncbi:hypothetical protein NCCP2495_17100 [Dietzia sp. NCCP-2495]|uniref:proton-conducting transporter transmembrane domain-containing protein n=1 Tax=Dietzia sp. NCCP-2495 TaxID=2934675 RepID=UPI00222F050C|nr:proton-conducting transporter membrane subunit [Dietzia sp. NCCP-2495]GLB63831.1 hypothetical protein NCCP2495_17100 [Dietzia sp. NCCP-2495]